MKALSTTFALAAYSFLYLPIMVVSVVLMVPAIIVAETSVKGTAAMESFRRLAALMRKER